MTVQDELDDLRPLDDAVADAPSGDNGAPLVDRADAGRDIEV